MHKEEFLPTILIFSPHKETCTWLKTSIGTFFDLIIAETEKEAFDCLAENSTDIIIFDERSKEERSWDFCRSLKKKEPYKNIPILAITTIESSRQIHQLFEAGVTDFLLAPLKPFEVKARLELALHFKPTAEIVSRAMEKFRDLSERDPLTDLYNRYVLDNYAIELISNAREVKYPLSMLMIDIDHFKDINDEYGHLIGDEVLIAFARLLNSSLRSHDLSIRYGGEEFVVLLPYTSKEQALIVAEKLCEKTHNRPFKTNHGPVNITISVGVTSFKTHLPMNNQEELHLLLQHVDKALYQAKKNGRNQVVIA